MANITINFNGVLNKLAQADQEVKYRNLLTDQPILLPAVEVQDPNKVIRFVPAGNLDIRKTRVEAFEEAASKFQESATKSADLVTKYRTAIRDQLELANNSIPTFDKFDDKVTSLFAKVNDLEAKRPSMSNYGGFCAASRESLLRCLENNATTPLTCDDVKKSFFHCVDKL